MNIENLPPYPHFPLKQKQTLYEIMHEVNKFYGTSLGRGSVEDSQVYKTKDGFLQLDVVCKKSGSALTTLKNYNPNDLIRDIDVDFSLTNPIIKRLEGVKFIESPLVVGLVKELDFLKHIPLKERVDIGTLDGVKLTRQLTNLLNQYSTLGRWVTGSMGDLSTAYFKLMHLGKLDGEWNGKVTEKSEYGAIIKITQGTRKGLICLMT